jgi:hypothetical protein
VRGEDFVEAEVQLGVAELRDGRRQVYRAAVADALLVGDGGERRDLDGATRQRLDVELQRLRHLFERQPVGAAALQLLVALARLKREVAAPRARAHVLKQQALARPRLELFERGGAQRARRGAEARDGRLRVNARDLVRRPDDGERDLRGALALRDVLCERAERRRPRARERDETRVVMTGHRAQKRAPRIERLGDDSQDLAA